MTDAAIGGQSFDNRPKDAETTDTDPKDLVADRLREVVDEKAACRFVPVIDGKKKCVNHTTGSVDKVDGNYGVYAGDGIVLIDIDDYNDDTSIPEELDELPGTFTVQTPHDGQHRYYVTDDDIASTLEARFGVKNPTPAWGEVRVNNQYVLGPGSELDDCDKDWCDSCATDDGGYYRITDDRPIARVSADAIVDLVASDPDYAESDTDGSETPSTENETDTVIDSTGSFDGDVEARLEYALETDEKLRNLWKGNYSPEGYSDDTSGADTALACKLAFYFNKDKRVVRQLLDQSVSKYPTTRSGKERKWRERTDDSYRENVLKYVDEQSDTVHPSFGSDATASSATVEAPAEASVTKDEASDRCLDVLKRAYTSDQPTLIEALPTIGKSQGAVEAAAETGVPVTILTERRELYDQLKEWCEEFGLESYTLPSFPEDCPTYQGAHGEHLRDQVKDWYHRDAGPQHIHSKARDILGHPLPCQQSTECPYEAKWKFDAENFDVLLGHYTHAFKERVVDGRVTVFDEYAGGQFDDELDEGLASSVSHFLDSHDEIPFDDYGNLIEYRRDETRRSEALAWFETTDIQSWSSGVFEEDGVHAIAPDATYTLLASVDNEVNGFERAELPTNGVGLYDPSSNAVNIRRWPDLSSAANVVALDGTPVQRLWKETLGMDLTHEQFLNTDERRQYLYSELDLNIVQTSEYAKPYSSENPANCKKDGALLQEIRREHGIKPALISTKDAIDEYETAGILEEVDEYEHYGNLKGMNDWSKTRLGVVVGSRHYGDEHVKREAAFAGEEAERGDGKGMDLDYGEFGNKVLRNMREHQTLQAMMRFGRDGDGATIYVHTAAFPEWVPATVATDCTSAHSDGMLEVRDALMDLGSGKTADVSDNVDSVCERQVRTHLSRLDDRGYVIKERDGRGVRWHDDGLDEINEFGWVELP